METLLEEDVKKYTISQAQQVWSRGLWFNRDHGPRPLKFDVRFEEVLARLEEQAPGDTLDLSLTQLRGVWSAAVQCASHPFAVESETRFHAAVEKTRVPGVRD